MSALSPITDWDNEPTVEAPAQTMYDIVYGDDGDAVPGHAAVGPERPTRDMRPLGKGRKGWK